MAKSQINFKIVYWIIWNSIQDLAEFALLPSRPSPWSRQGMRECFRSSANYSALQEFQFKFSATEKNVTHVNWANYHFTIFYCFNFSGNLTTGVHFSSKEHEKFSYPWLQSRQKVFFTKSHWVKTVHILQSEHPNTYLSRMIVVI